MLPWQPLRIEVVVGYTFDLLSKACCHWLRTCNVAMAMVMVGTRVCKVSLSCTLLTSSYKLKYCKR